MSSFYMEVTLEVSTSQPSVKRVVHTRLPPWYGFHLMSRKRSGKTSMKTSLVVLISIVLLSNQSTSRTSSIKPLSSVILNSSSPPSPIHQVRRCSTLSSLSLTCSQISSGTSSPCVTTSTSRRTRDRNVHASPISRSKIDVP